MPESRHRLVGLKHVSELLSRAAEAAIWSKKECITPELLQSCHRRTHVRMKATVALPTGLPFVP